jgi:triacylglycerol lipase
MLLQKRPEITQKEDKPGSSGFLPNKGFFLEYEKVSLQITSQFNANNAWWMAEMSRLAYHPSPQFIDHQLLQIGFSASSVFDNGSSQALVTYNDEIIIVAFRGTEFYTGLGDALIDLDFILTKFELGGQVHTGFKNAINSIWTDLKSYILPLMATRKLFYTGHSLGAAMSVIAAMRLPGLAIYNFGCPRVGNSSFVSIITTPFYRIAKHLDIVTKIPPPIFYKHTGKLILINEHGQINTNPTVFEEWKISDKDEWTVFKGILKHMILRGNTDVLDRYIHDHMIYNYSIYCWNYIVELQDQSQV